MTYPLLAARACVAASALALISMAALHILKPEVSPSRNMISQYALGRHEWVMAPCFASFGASSACLFVALAVHATSLLGWIGLGLLLLGLTMAACFSMDPASTPRERMSLSGRMHGVAFLLGVPCQLFAPLLLSLALETQSSYPPPLLLGLTAVIWLSLTATIGIMLMVGP